MTLRVVYSSGARFAGGGIGTTSYHAVSALHRSGLLARLLCGSFRRTEIPRARIRSMGMVSRGLRKAAAYDRARRLDHLYRVLYDRWASRNLLPCEVLLGWSGYGLRTIRRARESGSIAVLDRALAHPVHLERSMEQEGRRWGVRSRGSPTVRFIRREIELADHVLVPSEFVRQTFLEEGVPETKLTLIPFGVDADRFRPGPPPDAGRFIVLFVGQVSLRKGVPDLLEAWRLLRWARAELWLVGRNDLPVALRERYRTLGGVRFLGYANGVEATLRRAHVFVLPSLAEGSALVTYEAMACGLPVVTTPNAGSVARDEEDGYLVPARSPEALAARLETLRADDRLRERMGTSARRRAEAFPWERYGAGVVEALRGLVRDA